MGSRDDGNVSGSGGEPGLDEVLIPCKTVEEVDSDVDGVINGIITHYKDEYGNTTLEESDWFTLPSDPDNLVAVDSSRATVMEYNERGEIISILYFDGRLFKGERTESGELDVRDTYGSLNDGSGMYELIKHEDFIYDDTDRLKEIVAYEPDLTTVIGRTTVTWFSEFECVQAVDENNDGVEETRTKLLYNQQGLVLEELNDYDVDGSYDGGYRYTYDEWGSVLTFTFERHLGTVERFETSTYDVMHLIATFTREVYDEEVSGMEDTY
jgi:hypothetical protein